MSVSVMARPSPRPSRLKESARSVRSGVSRWLIAADPAAVELERASRHEDGDQHDEREHSAGCPKSMSRMREKRFT